MAEQLVDIEAPALWGRVLLPELVRAGATVLGRKEFEAMQAAQHRASFPADFPSTATYWHAPLLAIPCAFHF